MLAKRFAPVGEHKVDVTVTDQLDQLRGDEPQAALAGVIHVAVEAALDVGDRRWAIVFSHGHEE